MIESVKITDNKNLPINYASKIESLANGTEYKFKNGVNIIIGENGCGKSTLMRLMSMYLLCEGTMCSKFHDDVLRMRNMFRDSFSDGDKGGLKDGIDIKADYTSVVYNYMIAKEMSNDSILDSIHSISSYMESVNASTGEGITSMLYRLFDYAFSNKEINFPIDAIKELVGRSNDYWAHNLNTLLDYYERNKVKVTKENFAFTFLLDEPDRNVDVLHIEDLYKVLSYEKEYTQLICVIHNPILIYKLSKLDYVNFIEMSPGYLKKVKKVIDSI